MSGNVWEWKQKRYSTSSSRSIRGGSWANFEPQTCFMTTTRRCSTPQATANDQLGFPVMRVDAAVFGDANADGDVDLPDAAAFFHCFRGPGNLALPSGCSPLDDRRDRPWCAAYFADPSVVPFRHHGRFRSCGSTARRRAECAGGRGAGPIDRSPARPYFGQHAQRSHRATSLEENRRFGSSGQARTVPSPAILRVASMPILAPAA